LISPTPADFSPKTKPALSQAAWILVQASAAAPCEGGVGCDGDVDGDESVEAGAADAGVVAGCADATGG